jgi:hypothetical protein
MSYIVRFPKGASEAERNAIAQRARVKHNINARLKTEIDGPAVKVTTTVREGPGGGQKGRVHALGPIRSTVIGKTRKELSALRSKLKSDLVHIPKGTKFFVSQKQVVAESVEKFISQTKNTRIVSAKPRYYFKEFVNHVADAWVKTLENIGKKSVTYMKANMKEGKYRPWLSKRSSIYGPSAAMRPGGAILTQSKANMPRTEELLGLRKRLKYQTSTYGAKSKGAMNLRKKIAEAKYEAEWHTVTVSAAEAYRYNQKGTEHSIYSGVNKKIMKRRSDGRLVVVSEPWRSSRKLRQGGWGLIHWSAHPGTMPAPDTERLKKSLRYNIIANPTGLYSLQIGGYTGYAKTMELGTSKIKARPYIRPTVEHFRKELTRELDNQMQTPSGRSEAQLEITTRKGKRRVFVYAAHNVVRDTSGIPSGFTQETWNLEQAHQARTTAIAKWEARQWYHKSKSSNILIQIDLKHGGA